MVHPFVCMHVLIQVLLDPINGILDVRHFSLDIFKYCHGKISQETVADGGRGI